jgi:hypothetical protein
MLGGMLLTGTGVGLTLPTLMATAAGSLPPHSFASGSAVVNMIRQIGMAVGVAVLVVVLGAPGTPAGRLLAFHRGWWVAAVVALAGVIPALLLLRRGSAAASGAPEAAADPRAAGPAGTQALDPAEAEPAPG